MEEFKRNLFESLIALGIVISSHVKLFSWEKMISIVSCCKSPLFGCLASLQCLTELLSSQIVSPSILVFSTEISNLEWRYFSKNHQSIFSLVKNYTKQWILLIKSGT